jgi:hypothetical protein
MVFFFLLGFNEPRKIINTGRSSKPFDGGVRESWARFHIRRVCRRSARFSSENAVNAGLLAGGGLW